MSDKQTPEQLRAAVEPADQEILTPMEKAILGAAGAVAVFEAGKDNILGNPVCEHCSARVISYEFAKALLALNDELAELKKLKGIDLATVLAYEAGKADSEKELTELRAENVELRKRPVVNFRGRGTPMPYPIEDED